MIKSNCFIDTVDFIMTNALPTPRMFRHYLFSRASPLPPNLMLSNDTAIESILADIPFFSVGLMAFGVFTFLLIMKRVNLFAIYLYASALLAFGSAILDLSQILAQGRSNPNDGEGSAGIRTIIILREVGFALSFGFRFLFFWAFAAERPIGEPLLRPNPDDRTTNRKARENLHSGSWERWGTFGFALKWTSLGLTLSIPILQIIWRNLRVFDRSGPVYLAETTIEIVAAVLFILKLILNIYLSRVTPRPRILRFYLAPISALLITLAVAIGNAIYFAFSESILGRFLQAVDLYILILFVLIYAFYNAQVKTSRSVRGRRLLTSSFEGLPEKAPQSVFRVTPPPVPDLDEILVIGGTPSSQSQNQDSERRPSRVSVASRLSSWMMSRRISRRRLSSDQQQLWDQDGAERGNSPARNQQPAGVSPSFDMLSPRVDQADQIGNASTSKPRIMIPEPTETTSRWTMSTVATPTVTRQNTAFKKETNERDTVLSKSSAEFPPRVRSSRPFTSFSFSSYYGVESSTRPLSPLDMPPYPRGADSPVYGLNGIIERAQNQQLPRPRANRRSTLTSFDELLRQQTELDKSIAALRLFSPRDSINSLVTIKPILPAPGSERSRSSENGLLKPESASEFSLSIFPEPPDANSKALLPSPGTLVSLRAQSRAVQKDQEMAAVAGVVPPVKMFGSNESLDVPALPGSPGGDATATRVQRLDSAGTQYDVTSFIGDLTGPPNEAPRPAGTFKSADRLSDVESGDESPTINFTMLKVNGPSVARKVPPIITGSTRPGSPSPATASSGVLSSQTFGAEMNAPETGTQTKLSTFETSPPPSSPPNQQNQTSLSNFLLRKQARGLPSRPRIAISGPRPPPLDGKDEQAPGAFERPRPPPLILSQPDKVKPRAF